MVSLGLQAVGYEYVNIDDCYAEKNRSASGDIVAGELSYSDSGQSDESSQNQIRSASHTG